MAHGSQGSIHPMKSVRASKPYAKASITLCRTKKCSPVKSISVSKPYKASIILKKVKRFDKGLLACFGIGLFVVLAWYGWNLFGLWRFLKGEIVDTMPSERVPVPLGAKVLMGKSHLAMWGGYDEYMRLQCPGSAKQVLEWCKRKLEVGGWQVSEPKRIPQPKDVNREPDLSIDSIEPLYKFLLAPTKGHWEIHADGPSHEGSAFYAYQQDNQVILEYLHEIKRVVT